MRVFKTAWFTRFARSESIDDERLADAIARAEKGLIDADLGGGLIKQRVARQGKGRSGGFRTLIAYRKDERALFLFGFAKNERDNISDAQLADLKAVARDMLTQDDDSLDEAMAAGALKEIDYDEEA